VLIYASPCAAYRSWVHGLTETLPSDSSPDKRGQLNRSMQHDPVI
jgi:hypothetical protein